MTYRLFLEVNCALVRVVRVSFSAHHISKIIIMAAYYSLAMQGQCMLTPCLCHPGLC